MDHDELDGVPLPLPHGDGEILTAGPPPEESGAAIILAHGRGASAESILTLYHEIGIENLSALAPQAANMSWYPYSFMAPIGTNEPDLSSALDLFDSLVRRLLRKRIPSEKIALLGFSQGACLVLEFAARFPRRYGAVIGLTGGLIGPHGTPRNYKGSLNGTPVFLGTGDRDPHVPLERVQETRDVLKRMGASVVLRVFPGKPHSINLVELDTSRDMIQEMVDQEF